MKQDTFDAGDRVAILPEWQDGAGDALPHVVVADSEGTDRLTIAPAVWAHGSLVPTQVVRASMVRKV